MSRESQTVALKRCGTCEFYAGSREPNDLMTRVTIETNEKGKCLGRWKSQSFYPTHTCLDWKAWSVLRK